MSERKRTPLTPEQIEEAKRLKAIFEQRKAEARDRGEKITQADVAELCGWKEQSAVSQYMNGRIALNLDALLKFQQALKFEANQVSPRLAKFVAPPSQENVRDTAQPGRLYEYPVISWVIAGNWAEATEPLEPGAAESYMSSSYQANGPAFWLQVRGDSMTAPVGPSIPEGSMILVDKERMAQAGDLVVAKLTDSNEATFKKLVIDGGRKYLKALNPQYPIIEINGNCHIIGVAVRAEQSLI
ncbi:MAG: XRE family transcriptional regulator [Pseudomonadota bacterium]|nr:XRE family transcriptional regulator [Pseudomonadota bacterium]